MDPAIGRSVIRIVLLVLLAWLVYAALTIAGVVDESDTGAGSENSEPTSFSSAPHLRTAPHPRVINATSEREDRSAVMLKTIVHPRVSGAEVERSGVAGENVAASTPSTEASQRANPPAAAPQSRPLAESSAYVEPGEVITRYWPNQAQKAWRVFMCESGGDPHIKTNPNYRGGWQFSWSTWRAMGGTGDPADASFEEQTMRARALYEHDVKNGGDGWTNHWPVCGWR